MGVTGLGISRKFTDQAAPSTKKFQRQKEEILQVGILVIYSYFTGFFIGLFLALKDSGYAEKLRFLPVAQRHVHKDWRVALGRGRMLGHLDLVRLLSKGLLLLGNSSLKSLQFSKSTRNFQKF